MSKAVLVMDMPESCGDCKLRKNGCCEPHSWKNDICGVFYNAKNNSKPDWCPLLPMPEKKQEEVPVAYTHFGAYNDGWNACIDAIGGGDGD